MIINDLDGYYIVFDTKNWNTELDTLIINEKIPLYKPDGWQRDFYVFFFSQNFWNSSFKSRFENLS